MATTNATTVPTSAARNSCWAISAGIDTTLPTPRPKSTQPSRSIGAALATPSMPTPIVCTRKLAQAAYRRSVFPISLASSRRPATADSVVTLTAMAAALASKIVDKCDSRWDSTPTWANRANAKAAGSVTNARGLREAKLGDHGDKQWCEYHAAETRAIEGVTDRLRPFFIEPRNNHRVD